MDYSVLYYKKTDAKQFENEALLTNAILITSALLYGLGFFSLILLVAIVSICITRWMICVHELFHISKGNAVHPAVRLMLIPFTPFNIGYDEYQTTHSGHHRYNAGSDDPEGYHIRKSHFVSLLISMVYPEQSFLRYLKRHNLTFIQWVRVGIRLFLFLGLFALLQENFIVFWLVLRVCYGVNIWIFFHALHNKDGEYGTYAVVLPVSVKKLYQLLYGEHSLEATLHHNIHHQWPKMAYWHLAQHQTGAITTTPAPKSDRLLDS